MLMQGQADVQPTWSDSAPNGADVEPDSRLIAPAQRRSIDGAAERSPDPLRIVALAVTVALHLFAGWLVGGGWPHNEVRRTETAVRASDARLVVELVARTADTRTAVIPPMPLPPARVRPTEQPAPPPTAASVPQFPASEPPIAHPAPDPDPAPIEDVAEKAQAQPPAAAVAEPSSRSLDIDPARARREQDDYLRALMAWLVRHRVYPATAKKEKVQGVVRLRFSIDRAGRLLSSQVERGSGHPVLDAAALEVLSRAAPLPPLPDSMPMRTLTLSLPIDFSLTTR